MAKVVEKRDGTSLIMTRPIGSMLCLISFNLTISVLSLFKIA